MAEITHVPGSIGDEFGAVLRETIAENKRLAVMEQQYKDLLVRHEYDLHLIEALKGDQIALEKANKALMESNDRLRAEVYRLGVAAGFIVPMKGR